ncbi:MAG: hypothetical protein ACK5MB_01495, partial [Phycisphaerales bacterium]
SLGMRVASFLGALALATSVFFLFFRVWGLVPTPLQVTILVATPLLMLALLRSCPRRQHAARQNRQVAPARPDIPPEHDQVRARKRVGHARRRVRK